MSVGTDLQTATSSILTDLGLSATYNSIAKVGDPTTGDVTETVGAGVSTTVTPPIPFLTEGMQASDTIRVDDLRTFLQYTAVNSPGVGDRVTLNSINYNIISVSPVYAGDDIVLFELQLR